MGILGARNSSGTTMRNSYASGCTNQTLGSSPVSLGRFIMQGPLVNGLIAVSQNGCGSIARVEVEYTVP